MKRLLTILLAVFTVNAFAQSIKDRIVHNDPAKYRELTAVHAGAGNMGFVQLIGRNDLSTKFLYLHAGVIHPKSGIGHHFHHAIEEMYVILNGEAEFTINGRTSKIKAPAIVPCKLGNAHAIYNASNEDIRWLNFAVSLKKGQGEAFDLGDSRVGVNLDPIPVFVSDRLQHEKLKSEDPTYKGNGVLMRRMITPEIFNTDWNHVDHVLLPPGSSAVPRQMQGMEEVYYVLNGSGSVALGNYMGNIKTDDSFFVSLGETLTLSNAGTDNLELLVIGIAASNQKGRTIPKPLKEPKAMALQMDFVVPKENAQAFENMYYAIYVPAMTVQKGYLSSKLLRIFPDDVAKNIQAEPTNFNYQIQFTFDSEENRQKWVASKEHQIAWPAAAELATSYKWRGYDVMGDDSQGH